jgi:hypothetical protein
MKHIKILISMFLIIILFSTSGCINVKEDSKENDGKKEIIYNTHGELEINVTLEKNIFQLWGGWDSINVTIKILNIGNESISVLDLVGGVTFQGNIYNETGNWTSKFPSGIINFEWGNIDDSVHILNPGESISNTGMIIGGIIPDNPNWSYQHGGLLYPGKYHVVVRYFVNTKKDTKPFWTGELISKPVYFNAILDKTYNF